MASRVYHGICREVEEGQYKVIVSDIDLIEDDFQFNDGDLLSVYFLQANEDDSPTLAIYVGDTNEETSTIDDSGKSVKNRSVLFESSGAWEAGETVLFCYTKNYNQDNVYYWEIVEGGRATEDIYGVTKLEGNSSIPIGEWIITEDEDDWTTALTPGMLKKLYQALVGGEEREDEEQDPDAPDQIAPLLGLTWTSAIEGNKTALGTLSLNSNTGVTIDYPLEQTVLNIVGEHSQDFFNVPDRTSDLINDAYDSEKLNNTEDGHFYITNVLPTGKNLYYPGDNNQNFTFMIPNSDNNHTIVLNNHLSVPGSITGNTLTAAGAISGDTVTAAGAISGYQVSATNNIASNNTIIAGTNVISGEAIKEQGGWLRDRYSGKLLVVHHSFGYYEIPAHNTTPHINRDVSIPGYRTLGVVGYNINYARSNYAQDGRYCSVWECHITDNILEFSIYNSHTSKVVVFMYIEVLYEKIN